MNRRRARAGHEARPEAGAAPICGPAHPSRLTSGFGVVAAAVVLTLCGFAVYGNALCNPFLLDDNFVIVSDPRVHAADVGAI